MTDNWFNYKNKDMADLMERIMSNNDVIFADGLEVVIGDTEPELVEKARKFAEKRKELLENAHKRKGKFVVLLHNDAWCNNFLFR